MRLIESQREVIDTLRNMQKHSATDRKRAYFFIFIYVLGAIAFVCTFLHFISGWVAVVVAQLVQIIMVVMYTLSLNDYGERAFSAM